MKRIALVLLLLVACSHATPPPQRPQDTQLQMPGLIRGTVIAKDGSVLPGVIVTLDGRATTVTDAQGAFRFLSVPSGKHTVVAELAGYGRGARIVTISGSTGIQTSVVLNPSVSESIVVTAEAPLLDVRRSGSATTISMADPPPARDTWTVHQAAPAVQVDGINVGGYMWNLPGFPQLDLPAALAKLGHVSLVVDELGYDRSDHPHGLLACLIFELVVYALGEAHGFRVAGIGPKGLRGPRMGDGEIAPLHFAPRFCQ